MFWRKTIQRKIISHNLVTVPSRLLLFLTCLFFITVFTSIVQKYDSHLNSTINFENYRVGPRTAHFFKHMGPAHMTANSTETKPVLSNEILFGLDSKLNPVFLEHGELNVRCRYLPNMDLGCKYMGVIKEPKYYIQEVTFENPSQDMLEYDFSIFKSYNPSNEYDSSDTIAKLAAYFYILENSPGEVYKYPSLQAISKTKEYQTIRDRIVVMYLSVIKWTYVSNYVLWGNSIFFVICHFAILTIKISVSYFELKESKRRAADKKFFRRLENFSIFQLLMSLVFYILHRLIVLLNGITQSFTLASVSEGITFHTTKTTTENVSLLGQVLGVFVFLWILALIHHITFKDRLVYYLSTQPDEDPNYKNNLDGDHEELKHPEQESKV